MTEGLAVREPVAAEPDAASANKPASHTQTHRHQVVLVFQGGGALGAYQGGVYQALHEAGIEPDWIIGTSIGAINAALIAGNEPDNRLPRLQEFWRRMAQRDIWHDVALARTVATPSRTGRRCSAASPASSSPTRWRSWARMCRSAPTAPASIRPSR